MHTVHNIQLWPRKMSKTEDPPVPGMLRKESQMEMVFDSFPAELQHFHQVREILDSRVLALETETEKQLFLWREEKITQKTSLFCISRTRPLKRRNLALAAEKQWFRGSR